MSTVLSVFEGFPADVIFFNVNYFYTYIILTVIWVVKQENQQQFTRNTSLGWSNLQGYSWRDVPISLLV